MPVRFFVTDATVADCSVAETLVAEFQAEYLLADCGYDTDAIIRGTLKAGTTPVIPPKKNANFCATTIGIFISCDTSSKTHFCTSKDGAASPPVTLKMLHLLSRQSKLDVSLFG